MNEIGLTIRKYRKQLNLTSTELAEKIGVTQGSISQIETGRRNPSERILNDIADILDIPDDELDVVRNENREIKVKFINQSTLEDFMSQVKSDAELIADELIDLNVETKKLLIELLSKQINVSLFGKELSEEEKCIIDNTRRPYVSLLNYLMENKITEEEVLENLKTNPYGKLIAYLKENEMPEKEALELIQKEERFGTIMRKYRKKIGLTITDLAEVLNVSQSHISYIEINKSLPSEDLLNDIITVLKIPSNKLKHIER